MATKKASPAQLAARKTFADLARAGAFTKGKKRKPAAKKTAARKVAKKRNPMSPPKRPAVKRVVRRTSNPSPYIKRATPRPSMYAVHRVSPVTGAQGALVGKFPTLAGAKEFATAYANAHKATVGIVGKK